MRYGIILTAGDIHEIAAMAAEAEGAGWDGVFYWDGMAIPGVDPIYDPWVTLAAVAMLDGGLLPLFAALPPSTQTCPA